MDFSIFNWIFWALSNLSSEYSLTILANLPLFSDSIEGEVMSLYYDYLLFEPNFGELSIFGKVLSVLTLNFGAGISYFSEFNLSNFSSWNSGF